MAAKLEANQYANWRPDQIPKHPYTKIYGESARHTCSVCQLPMRHVVHDALEAVAA